MLQNFIRNFRIIEINPESYLKWIWNEHLLCSSSTRSFVAMSPVSVSTSTSLSTLSTANDKVTDGEKRIKDILEKTFPNAVLIKVQDVSGGCGSMYTVGVQTKEFKGLPIIKQHRLVHEALKQEIKDMHGIQISTTAPLP